MQSGSQTLGLVVLATLVVVGHSEVLHESLSEVGEERQLMSIFQLNPVGERMWSL